MTRDDIIRMAREAGLGSAMTHHGGDPRVWIEGADWHDELMRFAELAQLVEREACAKTCMEEAPSLDGQLCAAAIRARGEK